MKKLILAVLLLTAAPAQADWLDMAIGAAIADDEDFMEDVFRSCKRKVGNMDSAMFDRCVVRTLLTRNDVREDFKRVKRSKTR